MSLKNANAADLSSTVATVRRRSVETAARPLEKVHGESIDAGRGISLINPRRLSTSCRLDPFPSESPNDLAPRTLYPLRRSFSPARAFVSPASLGGPGGSSTGSFFKRVFSSPLARHLLFFVTSVCPGLRLRSSFRQTERRFRLFPSRRGSSRCRARRPGSWKDVTCIKEDVAHRSRGIPSLSFARWTFEGRSEPRPLGLKMPAS